MNRILGHLTQIRWLFYGKGLKSMVAYDVEAPAIADTTLFDDDGNMIDIKKQWDHRRFSYDSLHFVTRLQTAGEDFSNYVVSYSAKSDRVMVQTWSKVTDDNWAIERKDTDRTDKFDVEFQLDDDTRIVEELNRRDGTVILYQYGDDGQLISKTTKDLNDQKTVESWTYLYGKTKALVKAEYRLILY